MTKDAHVKDIKVNPDGRKAVVTIEQANGNQHTVQVRTETEADKFFALFHGPAKKPVQ